ncbi:MAG: 6-bladed beta-propeller [Balneolaceae bacterium]
MDKFGYIIICLLLYMGCTNQQTIDLPSHISELENLTAYSIDTKPVYQIQFEKQQTFGDTDEVLFQRMGDIAIDDDGRVLISESTIGYRNIYVFNPNGSYIGRIGSEGNGPGEYRTPTNLQIKSNQLYVYDNLLKRVSKFSMNTFSHVSSFLLESDVDGIEFTNGMTVHNILVRNDGQLLIGVNDPPIPNNHRFIHYFLFDQQGSITSEELLRQRDETIFGDRFTAIMPDFNSHPLLSITSEDQIIIADSGEFLIQILDQAGQYIRAFYYPFNNLPLEKERYLDEKSTADFERATVERIYNNVEFPETWPALESMLVDEEDRIWVSTIVEREDIYHWWILENTGELVAKFDWPRDKPIKAVKNGFLYTLETNEETSLQQIIRYRIDMSRL